MRILLAILLALSPSVATAACGFDANGNWSCTRPTLFGGVRTVVRQPAPAVAAYRAARYQARYATPVQSYGSAGGYGSSGNYSSGERFLHWGPPTASDYPAYQVTPPQQPTPAPQPQANAAPASCEGCQCRDELDAMASRLRSLEDNVKLLKAERQIFGTPAKKELSQQPKRELSEAIATYRPPREIPLTLAVR